MMKKIYAIFILCLMSSMELLAQNGGFAGASSQLGFSPRGMAMSNALTASTSDGIYPFYNPALASAQAENIQSDLTVASLDFDRVYQTMGAHFQLPPNAGLYISIMRSGVNDIDERTRSGYPLGTVNTSEYQIATSFGIRFTPKLNMGIGFKINYSNLHEDVQAATAVGVDIGMLYHLSSKLNLGLTIQDMFANYTWNSGDLYGNTQSRNVINNFPVRYKVGLSYQDRLFSISSDFEIRSYISEINEVELFTGIDGIVNTFETIRTINTSSYMYKIGGSWNPHERVTLRGGYKLTDTSTPESNSFSTGFSLHLPLDIFSPSIDYAFVREPYGISNMHVFALRLHL